MKTKNVNKSTERADSKKKSKLVTFGGLHLMLNLTLPDYYFEDKELKFEQINSLKEISFLKEEKELWNNVIITSNYDTINLILQANVPFTKKVMVDYVLMNKISFSDEQKEFKEIIMEILQDNSIQVIENEVCNCNIAILLYVKWKEHLKSFSLCNETHFASKEEKEEEEMRKEKEEDEKRKQSSNEMNNDNELNVENEQNKEGEKQELQKEKLQKEELQKEKLQKEELRKQELQKEELRKQELQKEESRKQELQKEELQRQELEKETQERNTQKRDTQKKDTQKKESDDQPKDENLAILDQKIREDPKSNLVRENSIANEAQPPEQESNIKPPNAEASPEKDEQEKKKKEDVKELDEHNPFFNMEVQCNSYDYIFVNFCDYTKGELGTSVTLKDLLAFFINLKLSSSIKIILNTINSLPPSMINEDMETFESILQVVDFIFGDKKETTHLFQALHDYHQEKTKFEKKRYLDVFYNLIACKSLSQSKHKIALYLDEFNKMQLAETNGSKMQQITEVDASLYPKINHYNHKQVEEYKKLISDNYLMYSTIFVGAFVGKLIQGSIDLKTIYSAYLIGIESVKKIVELNKHGLEKPKDPEFYIARLPKDKIDKKIGQDMLKTKEKSFVLDCINTGKSKLRYYNSLFDSHLNSFFSNDVNRKELKTKGFINSRGFIMYDSVYRDLLGGSKKRKRNVKPDQSLLIKTINNINVGEYVPNKEVNAEEKVLRETSPLSKKLPFKQACYTNYSKMRFSKNLPPLKTSSNYQNSTAKSNQRNDHFKSDENTRYDKKDNMEDSKA